MQLSVFVFFSHNYSRGIYPSEILFFCLFKHILVKRNLEFSAALLRTLPTRVDSLSKRVTGEEYHNIRSSRVLVVLNGL